MRHSLKIKNKVKELRLQGISLDKIHGKTKVPKTTIRTWIKDIKLSKKQFETLRENTHRALQEGRKRKQAKEKELKFKNENALKEKGINTIGKLSKRDFLIAGSALYWAEGFKNKHEHRLGFCNSDPKMIKFYINWLQEVFDVDKKDIVLRLTINDSYREKTKIIEKYWSEITDIPTSQFSKTFYQKSIWKKQYNVDNYHGVLRIHVKSTLNSLLLVKGLIEGLRLNSNK